MRIWTKYRGLSTKWQIAIAATLAVIGISAAAGPSDDTKPTIKTDAAASSSPTTDAAHPTTTAAPAPTTTAAPPTTAAPTTTTAPPQTTTTAAPVPAISISQQNARGKAADYLDYSAFSRSGLIDQLKYEGFNEGDATYGVDSLGVDWNDQAAKKSH